METSWIAALDALALRLSRAGRLLSEAAALLADRQTDPVAAPPSPAEPELQDAPAASEIDETLLVTV
jgi:hypothetical protein